MNSLVLIIYVLIFVIMIVTAIFFLILALCAPAIRPYLMAKLKEQSILILAGDDGVLRFEPVDGADIYQSKRAGAWTFTRDSSYLYGGIPTFIGYVRGPAMTANMQTHVAAMKLKMLGIAPERTFHDTIKAAIKEDDKKTKDAFLDFVWAQLSKKERASAEAGYAKFYEEKINELTNKFATEVGMADPEEDCTVDDFIAAEFAAKKYPMSALEYYLGTISEEEFENLLDAANADHSITPVDVTALYDYANAQNAHVINAKIQRGISDYIQSTGIMSKFTMQHFFMFLMFMLVAGIVIYMVMSGSAQNAVDAGMSVVNNTVGNNTTTIGV